MLWGRLTDMRGGTWDDGITCAEGFRFVLRFKLHGSMITAGLGQHCI